MVGVSHFQGRSGASFVSVQFFLAFLSFPKGEKTKQKTLRLHILCELAIKSDYWKKIMNYKISVYN